MANFELITTRVGAISIKNLDIDQVLHNPLGPIMEAQELYLQNSRLEETFIQSSNTPVVIYDVGLGAGANALAAIKLHKKVCSTRPLKIVSFENDLSLAGYALEQANNLSFLEGYEKTLSELVTLGSVKADLLDWEVLLGEFTNTVLSKQIPNPDVIFYDMYSPKIDSKLWTIKLFKDLYMRAQENPSGGILITYSRATAIRTALLAAGFCVGTSSYCDGHLESTIASVNLNALNTPLPLKWLTKLETSSNAWPSDVADFGGPVEISRNLCAHRQFKASTQA